MLRQISLGSVGLVVGGGLSIVGFTAYFLDNATLNLVGFFYGIPLLLGGLALKAAELKPVPFSQPTPEAILSLREQQATSTQNQIRKDVTRYRYGQEAHLDSSLKYLGLDPSDEERPVLQSIREEAIDGSYALVLEFESPLIKFEDWQKKREKIERFFGPGLRVELHQSGSPDENRVDVTLIATPDAAGNTESLG
ncbi:DUF2854 domain-containing protein [Thermocoleostomius sinensis]|jgi:hypothetical protein|uniref:DUF2854 domain-containing protein n=1 Tax=Thermocoleostomius sinensis A174 TaxID=2016057 RepID=A0A9E8ZIB6_9CYAN|nr:DUF2854 domain-containing protein [Thermocoleostomius sinensis]WAL62232.1 DUF2854 domain-containing protein [Thermocoleostomius sinensis A174]